MKYGKEHFYSVLLEKCLEIEAGEKEKYYIQLYDAVKNGYNISYGGEGESQVDIEMLKNLATQGYSFNEIAQITNHSKKTVSVRLRNLGYKSPYNIISGYKDKGIKVKWNEIEFNSYTLLAKYLKENVEIFKDKKK